MLRSTVDNPEEMFFTKSPKILRPKYLTLSEGNFSQKEIFWSKMSTWTRRIQF